MALWWILAAVAALAWVYWQLTKPHKYWVEKGVEQSNPRFLFGDIWGTVFKTQSFAEMVQMVYNECPNVRYSGFYQFFLPTLLLKDPDLIKQITVKDFNHFEDHRTLIPEDTDPLWSKNLLILTGKKWRDMRSTLSPAFTSSKMKCMFSLISESGERFVKHFLDKNENLITVELKDIFTRFANDVIANTAFGVECDSLRERNNEFYLMGKEATDFSGFGRSLKFFSYLLVPKIAKSLNLQLYSTAVANFFTKIVKSNIESREKYTIVRPDMINLLLEARKNGLDFEEASEDTGFATVQESEITKSTKKRKHEITDLDITAQALSFFFAGFDTVSTLMSFMTYELAVNQDIQQRLIEEVDETRKASQGELTYEAVVGMKYMDMVVSETLRKWPATIAIDRICTKPYTIKPESSNEKLLHLEKNTVLWLPIFAIHRDPRNYPDPEKFDPERFSDGNKNKIISYTYLPFGSGPRNCIGSRLALLETKILFYYLLSKFEIVPVEKSKIPVVLSKKEFNLSAEGGFWFGLKRRGV